MEREGLSVRAIAAEVGIGKSEVGIGKSVVGARIARAEAAERARAESPASTQSMSGPANSRAASATTSSDLHVAGAIDVRASDLSDLSGKSAALAQACLNDGGAGVIVVTDHTAGFSDVNATCGVL